MPDLTDPIPGLPLPLSGETRIFAILGDPISQVGSPRLFNTAFRQRNAQAVLVPMHVAPDDLADAVRTFRKVRNFDGLVITVPHKIEITELVDEVGPMARRVGAVNAIRKDETGRLIGENFDGAGFVRGVARHGHSFAGLRVLVIGAGGAGRAVAHSIADERPASLAIYDIDASRAAALANELKALGTTSAGAVDAPIGHGMDAIVNCTSIGMRSDDPLPASLAGIASDALVVDIVLKPPRTRLLEEADRLGCTTVEGVHMLEGQIQAICDFFRIGQA